MSMTETTFDRSTEVNDDDQADPGKLSHIVPPDNGPDGRAIKTGIQKVMEARVNGTPVTALCGWTWVPSQDPKQFPLCHKCKEIVEGYKEDLRDPNRMPRS